MLSTLHKYMKTQFLFVHIYLEKKINYASMSEHGLW